jgi:hypothetical protein
MTNRPTCPRSPEGGEELTRPQYPFAIAGVFDGIPERSLDLQR